MERNVLEAKKDAARVEAETLAQRIQQLDTMRKTAYEDFLRVQGRLAVLDELLAAFPAVDVAKKDRKGKA